MKYVHTLTAIAAIALSRGTNSKKKKAVPNYLSWLGMHIITELWALTCYTPAEGFISTDTSLFRPVPAASLCLSEKSFHNHSGSSVKHELGVCCHLAKPQPAHLALIVLEKENHLFVHQRSSKQANFHIQPEREGKISMRWLKKKNQLFIFFFF